MTAAQATTPIQRATGFLPARSPFDFQQSLRFLEDFTPTRGEQLLASHDLTKALSVAGQPLLFRLSMSDTSTQPGVSYRLYAADPLSDATRQAAEECITNFLSLNDDLEPFYVLGRADSHFEPVIRQLYGLHHVRFLTLAEAACWAILTQRVAIPVAHKMKQALMEAYGERLELEGQTYWAFPELARLAHVRPAEFAALIKNERRAFYLCNVIEGLNRIDESFLRTAPYDEAWAYLLGIKGVGTWSASFLLLRALGRMERLPLETEPFKVALARLYGPAKTWEKVREHYGPWIGYWSYYLRTAD